MGLLISLLTKKKHSDEEKVPILENSHSINESMYGIEMDRPSNTKTIPNQQNVLFERGLEFLQKGEFEHALKDFLEMYKLEPSGDSVKLVGFAYISLEKNGEALKYLTKAIELEPNDSIHYSNRGACFRKLKRFKEALSDFSTAEEIDPKNEAIFLNRGTLHQLRGNFDEAEKEFSKAIAVGKKIAHTWILRGFFYERNRKEYKKALSDFLKATEIMNKRNTKNPDPYKFVEEYQDELKSQWKNLQEEQSDNLKEKREKFLEKLKEAKEILKASDSVGYERLRALASIIILSECLE